MARACWAVVSSRNKRLAQGSKAWGSLASENIFFAHQIIDDGNTNTITSCLCHTLVVFATTCLARATNTFPTRAKALRLDASRSTDVDVYIETRKFSPPSLLAKRVKNILRLQSNARCVFSLSPIWLLQNTIFISDSHRSGSVCSGALENTERTLLVAGWPARLQVTTSRLHEMKTRPENQFQIIISAHPLTPRSLSARCSFWL